MKISSIVLAALASLAAPPISRAQQAAGITYQLPFDGTKTTYRVTIAAAPAEDPDWIVSTFVAGAVRSVTAQNQGVFTDVWDRNDDNFKPVPAGKYVLKGIYMPSEMWKIDGQQHSIVPQFISSPGDSWTPVSATRKWPRTRQFTRPHPFW